MSTTGSTLQLATITFISLVTGGLIGAFVALPLSGNSSINSYSSITSPFALFNNNSEQSTKSTTTPEIQSEAENSGFTTNSENSGIVIEDNDEDEEGDDEDEEEEEDDDDEDEDEVPVDSRSLNDIPGEVRMALVIRTDLGMQKGKVAAQCAHAAVNLYKSISGMGHESNYNPEMLKRWEMGGQAKITLKCQDREEMDLLFATAISLNVNSTIIHDAGRTQIAAGSATVLGLGPAPKSVLDQITGDLKLY